MSFCARCRAPLSQDEIALTRKIVHRGATEFFCLSCLSAHFDIPVPKLREMIEHFREAGCLLFAPKD